MVLASIGIRNVSIDRVSEELKGTANYVPVAPALGCRQGGFTLIETLVALAIFTGMIAVVYEGMAANWRAIRRTEMDTVAMTLANTQFALAGLDTALANGQSFSGRHGEIAWTVDVESYFPPNGTTSEPVFGAYWLIFNAKWSDGWRHPARGLRVRSLKLGSMK